jgi:hypothetical protein
VIQEAQNLNLTGSHTTAVTLTYLARACRSLTCTAKLRELAVSERLRRRYTGRVALAESCHGDIETVWSGSGRSPSHCSGKGSGSIRLLTPTGYHGEPPDLYNQSRQTSLFESRDSQQGTLDFGGWAGLQPSQYRLLPVRDWLENLSRIHLAWMEPRLSAAELFRGCKRVRLAP